MIFLKTVKVFLFVVFALFALSSCFAKENALLESQENITQPQNFSFETEHSEYSNDLKTISYLITNTCDREIVFTTEAFDLQYKTDDGWKVVAFKEDMAFYELSTVLKPNESSKEEIQLDKYYNLPLLSGEYRIIKDSYASNIFKIN